MGPEVISKLKNKEYVPDYIENEIRRIGIITGSRVFGGFSGITSDIDIILPPKCSFSFDDLIHYGWYESSSGWDDDMEFKSIYVKARFTKSIVNLLFTKDEGHYEKWVRATHRMKELKNVPFIRELNKNKRFRVSLFEEMKRLPKTVIE
jgi:hypothetical protein